MQSRPAGGRSLLALLAVALLIGAANLFKPVHIDDALYLSIARHITQSPLDPYSGPINWTHEPLPAYKVSISPPLLNYYFALIIALFGESIPVLHAAMIPWILLAAWSMVRLGERLVGSAMPAALVLVSPAFVVGINLMLDVPLLACVAGSLEFLFRGLEIRGRGRIRRLLLASLLGAAAVLIKYPAVVLLPLYLLVACLRRRLAPLGVAILPLVAFLAWQRYSGWLYGASQVGEGIGFLSRFLLGDSRGVVERTLTMFALVATTFPVWILTAWRGRYRFRSAMIAGVIALLAKLMLVGHGARELMSLAFVAGVFLGAFSIVDVLLASLLKERGGSRQLELGDRLFLLAWIAGFALFAILFAPFVAVRSFLPVLFPLAVLMMSAYSLGGRAASPAVASDSAASAPQSVSREQPRDMPLTVTLAISAVLSGLLAWTDFRWASVYPRAVESIAHEYADSGRPILFLGHWGWQYYAERAGWQPWDARWTAPPPGAIVVIPTQVDKQFLQTVAHARLRRIRTITIGPHSVGLTTWHRPLGFRFYGGDYGQLPWGITSEPTEEFEIFEAMP